LSTVILSHLMDVNMRGTCLLALTSTHIAPIYSMDLGTRNLVSPLLSDVASSSSALVARKPAGPHLRPDEWSPPSPTVVLCQGIWTAPILGQMLWCPCHHFQQLHIPPIWIGHPPCLPLSTSQLKLVWPVPFHCTNCHGSMHAAAFYREFILKNIFPFYRLSMVWTFVMSFGGFTNSRPLHQL
jgi:hypothetical protein